MADADHEVERDPERPDELDAETRARRAAALAQIVKFGDPVLTARAVPVDRFDDVLRTQVVRMGRLMNDAIGVGLAAPQVGISNRVLVYRAQPEASIAALVNPEVEWSGTALEPLEEGCLSLPGVLLEVDRPIHVRVRASDERGEDVVVEASGLEARVLQHEIDHLDGVLTLDRVSRDQRKRALRALRDAEHAA